MGFLNFWHWSQREGPVSAMKLEDTREAYEALSAKASEIVRQLGHQTAPFHIPPYTAEGC